MRTQSAAGFATFALLLWAPAAAAQTPEATPTPAPSPSPGFTHYMMAEITVVAEAPHRDSATLTTELTAADIEATNSRTVAEALAFGPGLRMSVGRKNEPQVSLHGFDHSRILVLVDGVPYYETSYGKLDLNQLSTGNVARVEVVRGGASVLYGANALGGVINVITRRPAEKPFTGILAEIGEDSAGRLALSHGQRRGGLTYWLSYNHEESDGWDLSGDFEPREGTISRRPGGSRREVIEDGDRRLNSDLRRDDVWAKVGWEKGESGAWYANLHFLDMEKAAPPAIDAVSVFLSRPAFSHFTRMPSYRDWGVDLDGRQSLGSVGLKAKLFHHRHLDDYQSFLDASYSELIAVSRYQDSLSGGSLLAELQPRRWGTVRAAVHYRIDAHSERDDDYLPFADSRSSTGTAAVEAQITRVDRLTVVAGVGLDWFDVSAAERNITASSGDLLRQDPLRTPRTDGVSSMLGATYSFPGGTRLFALAARKGRFPTLQQLYSSRSGNPGLVPERNDSLVLGVSFPLGKRVVVGVSGFHYDLTDMISRNGPPTTSTYLNCAEARMRGVELDAAWHVRDEIVFRADYTFNDAKDHSPVRASDELTNVPRHKGGFGVSLRAPGWRTALDVHGVFASEVFTSLPTPQHPTDPVEKVDSSFVLDGRLAQPLLKKLDAFLAVRNLLDEDIESEPGYPAPGRAVSIGLNLRF